MPKPTKKKSTTRKRKAAAEQPEKKSRKGFKRRPATAPAGTAPAEMEELKTSAGFPIVAIGASAGGLDAFKQLLSAMPADSGMALVLIPHLDPAHESLMVELLARQTSMPVTEASQGTQIEANHVYVIPPNKYLAVTGGRLVLSEPPRPHRLQTVIDYALRSLARDQQDDAIGIVLSGTGAHGTVGVREIKAAGGMVMVQSPQTAEYDQMPRSAIATGLVDYVLAPQQMPAALIDYIRRAHEPAQRERAAGEDDGGNLKQIVTLLRARSRYDFRHYRKNMLLRRVRRRLGMLRLDSLGDYLERLRSDSGEVRALYKDLLIGVTSFFREPEAFDVLEKRVLPELVESLRPDASIRVWVPGCATGEEAYSIGMLLIEQFQRQGKPAHIQIFATDIDDDALEVARQGVYADSIAESLSPELLRRFFTKVDEHHYQVGKALRESIVFAPQNLITDAPFSRLHLVSCRNVLIYLEPGVQAQIISLLHFALTDGGYLLLGPSESIGGAVDMFEPVSKQWRVFRRIGPVRRDRVNIPIVAGEESYTRSSRTQAPGAATASFTDVMQRLLAVEFAPASCLVNRKYEILCIQGPLVNYLEFPPGEPSKDLLAMARQGLRAKLRAACHAAVREQHVVTETDARVKRNGDYVPCKITVRPLSEPKALEGLLLVVFQDQVGARETKRAELAGGAESPIVEQLEDELQATREDLQSTIEELESSNEELKASNEEVMSMNEELQSANEELETSKEELQSLNEELATVNNQLQDRIEDLAREGDDMANLIASTDIATVFLDPDLNIKRFTPPTGRLLNLLPTDVGRPFRNFAPRFTDDTLAEDCEGVLQTLQPYEKEVCSDEGRWYLRRIMPYRTTDDRIAGVVVTFIDVTRRMEGDARLRGLANVLLEANDAVIVTDFSGRITAWNRGAELLYGYTEAEALTKQIGDITADDAGLKTRDLARRVEAGETVESFETQRRTRDGRVLHVWVSVTPQKDETGKVIAIATVERDVTARHRAEEQIRGLNEELEERVTERTAALQASERRVRAVLDGAADAIVTIDSAGHIETFNRAAERMFGYSAAEALGHEMEMLISEPHRPNFEAYLQRSREARETAAAREMAGRRKNGTAFPIELSSNPIDHLDLLTLMIRDLTEQKTLQQEILQIATLEQQRIGQELHDSTQQELTGLGLLAQNLSDALAGRDREHSDLSAKLAAGIAQTNRNVRAIAKGLLPVDVHAESLMSALSELAETTSRDHPMRCRFECRRPVHIADDVIATHLYRIAQEAVTNAVKHSKARTVTIRLKESDSVLALEVLDDGIGVGAAEASKHGLGLRTMAYRCSLIGGTLDIEGAPGRGTRIVCSLVNGRPA